MDCALFRVGIMIDTEPIGAGEVLGSFILRSGSHQVIQHRRFLTPIVGSFGTPWRFLGRRLLFARAACSRNQSIKDSSFGIVNEALRTVDWRPHAAPLTRETARGFQVHWRTRAMGGISLLRSLRAHGKTSYWRCDAGRRGLPSITPGPGAVDSKPRSARLVCSAFRNRAAREIPLARIDRARSVRDAISIRLRGRELGGGASYVTVQS